MISTTAAQSDHLSSALIATSFTSAHLSAYQFTLLQSHPLLIPLSLHIPAMDVQKIPDFLAQQLQQAPEHCQASFLSFEDFWERKLWHQLTDALVDFFRLPESAPQRLPMFKSFVLSFADKINQLKFVSLGLMASTECAGILPVRSPGSWTQADTDTIADDQERLAFLSSLADKVNKHDTQDAYIYALADVANVKQRLQNLDGARKDLEICQRVLDSFDAVETVVHASFYKVNAEYYHVGITSPKPGSEQNLTAATNRPKKNLPRTTKTPSSTSPASTSRTSRTPSARRAPTTSAWPRWCRTRSTTSASC